MEKKKEWRRKIVTMTERTTTNDWSIQKHGQDFSLLFTSKFGASDANNLRREKEKEEKKEENP